MLFLRRPTAEAIRAFLARQARLDLTYPAVGATATSPPAGYVVDHTRMRLGAGEKVFAAAKAALRGWQQLRLGWPEAWPPATPIREGRVAAILARSIGMCDSQRQILNQRIAVYPPRNPTISGR